LINRIADQSDSPTTHTAHAAAIDVRATQLAQSQFIFTVVDKLTLADNYVTSVHLHFLTDSTVIPRSFQGVPPTRLDTKQGLTLRTQGKGLAYTVNFQ
jgi:hypothetical protein